jgi:hypothetical protein
VVIAVKTISHKAEVAITITEAEAIKVSLLEVLSMSKEEEETVEVEAETEEATIRVAAVFQKVRQSQALDQDKRVNWFQTTLSCKSKTRDLSIFTRSTGALWATSGFSSVRPSDQAEKR